ncbi:MAG: hypothetical protein EXR39_19360 [Betaproteobacteria bacterium]|nr:hypothetical protein [Betaproteobacteria bacterium]
MLVRSFREREFAVVAVTDTGIGMSPEFIREHLFKPFQSTKNSGMGIGAYESARYVNSIGGHITVDSKQESGTCIRVHLPVAESTVPCRQLHWKRHDRQAPITAHRRRRRRLTKADALAVQCPRLLRGGPPRDRHGAIAPA